MFWSIGKGELLQEFKDIDIGNVYVIVLRKTGKIEKEKGKERKKKKKTRAVKPFPV